MMTVEPAEPRTPPSDEPKIREVEVSLDDAVRYAIALLSNGRAPEAMRIFEMATEMAPDRADALHFHGIALHQTGSSEKGLAQIDRSLALQPGEAGWWNNRGNVLRENGRFDEAVDSFKQAIDLNEAFAEPYNNLGILQRERNNFDIAEACFKKALSLNPEFADAYSNYGNLLVAQKRTAEGIHMLMKSVTLRPENFDSKRSLAYAYGQLGEFDKARRTYEDWLKDDPGNPIAEHHLVAVSGGLNERASDKYVRQVFDAFAPSFDTKLAYLNYRAPELVNDALTRAMGPSGSARVIADAGCGTGLCGPGLRPMAAQLIGVDLSSAMLQRAKERGCYDALHEAELTAFLMANPDGFDAIVSADTLCYFGDLSGAFAAAYGALKPGGHLVFTVEEFVSPAAAVPDAGADTLVNADANPGIKLCHHGRFAHTRTYVSDMLRQNGLTLTRIDNEILRSESGVDVRGLVVVAEKPRLPN